MILIKQVSHNPPTLDDTLYVEMYIALKTCSSAQGSFLKEAADIVIERVDKLVCIDKDPYNQRHYFDAKSIVYNILEDYDGFWETAYQSYNTYPYNSIERLSSLGFYYLIFENEDSARYYLNKTIDVSKNKLNSSDTDEAMLASLSIINSYIYLKDDDTAKLWLNKLINNTTDTLVTSNLKKITQEKDFYEYKSMLWEGVLKSKKKLN